MSSPIFKIRFVNGLRVRSLISGFFRKEDAVSMGNLGVHTIAWESRCCELGYWILGDFEGWAT